MTPDPYVEKGPVEPRLVLLELEQDINDLNISDSVRLIFRRIQKCFDVSMQNFRDHSIQINAALGAVVIFQFWQIEAGDLSSSDDPDGNPVVRSVLNTNGLLQSDYQFNWMRSHALRPSTVILGPGDGVPKHHVIIDRDDVNLQIAKFEAVGGASVMTSSNVARPYGMDPDNPRLQFGEFRPALNVFQFWPSSIAVGTWAYLEQQLPQVNIP